VNGKDVVENYEAPKLVTFHARTRKDMSKVPARWERIARAVEIRDEIQNDLSPEDRTLIFGNGDINSLDDAIEKVEQTKSDGAMAGRGLFGKPWLFSGKEPNLKKRLNILVEHAEMFDKYVSHKNFAVMRKHFKAYVEGFDGAKELRVKLMATKDSDEVKSIIKEFIKSLG
jgi:tRNA-dihydrouridine synthase